MSSAPIGFMRSVSISPAALDQTPAVTIRPMNRSDLFRLAQRLNPRGVRHGSADVPSTRDLLRYASTQAPESAQVGDVCWIADSESGPLGLLGATGPRPYALRVRHLWSAVRGGAIESRLIRTLLEHCYRHSVLKLVIEPELAPADRAAVVRAGYQPADRRSVAPGRVANTYYCDLYRRTDAAAAAESAASGAAR